MGKLGRNEPCWCGSGKKYKKCHEEFDEKISFIKSQGHEVPDHSIIKTPQQIEAIKESCKINIAVLDYVAEHIRAGMTTQEIDDLVAEKTAELGGIPAPLNYEGYPKSVCTSMTVILSMLTAQRFIKATSPTRQECSVSERFLPKRKNSLML